MKRSNSVVAAVSGLAMACGLALSGCGGSASTGAAPAASGGTHTSGKLSCPDVSVVNSMLAIHDKGPAKINATDGSTLCLYTAVSGKGSANVVINSHYTKAGFASAKAQFKDEKGGHLSSLPGLGDEAISYVTSSISVDTLQGSLFVHAAANSTTLARVESLVRHILQAA
jgi:hypothetical protein